jgi:glycosyltransferase involved in cell wall biosynthesis
VLESLLSQDLDDLEVVICDNDSEDETVSICEEYASGESRIKVHRNGRNIGQVENFNRVLGLSQGTYFRWIGADDWLERDYASRCVQVLDGDPAAVAVTTYQDHVDDDGNRFYREYEGPRADSNEAHLRFARMLWFCRVDRFFIDPIYSMFRRDHLLRTRLLQLVPVMDQVLAAELSLVGPFQHIPRCLAHRRLEPLEYRPDVIAELARRYHPANPQDLERSMRRICREFAEVVRRAPLSSWQRLYCYGAIATYAAALESRRARASLRRLPGYSVLRSTVHGARRMIGN